MAMQDFLRERISIISFGNSKMIFVCINKLYERNCMYTLVSFSILTGIMRREMETVKLIMCE